MAFMFLASSAAAKTHQVSVCTLLRTPASFDNAIVTLRATVSSGFEIFAIRDPKNAECGSIWLEYAGGGPMASTSLGALTPNASRPELTLRDDSALKRFHALLNARMYPRDRAMTCMGCNRYEVSATMTGRIDYAGPDRGFGHLNMFPLRFVLQSVPEVSAKDDASRFDRKEFSTKPVRFPTAYLSGLVLAPDGTPVQLAPVNAVSTEDVPLFLRDFPEWTDSQGAFAFEVPPGTYRIGVNLEAPPSPDVPYAATYLPRTLVVADRQRMNDLVIRLSEKLTPRPVPLTVVWPDGQPVEEANVWLAEVRNPHAVVGTSVSHTNEDGQFDLIGFEGTDYVIHANIYVKPTYRPHCAENRVLDASHEVKERIVMVLTRTGDVCRGAD